MFSNGDSDRASASDSKTIIDGLSKTLKFGEKLRNDRLRSEEKKRRALNEVKSRVNESMAKQRKLQEEITRLDLEIKNSKIQIQKHQYDFETNLTTLVNQVKSPIKSNANAQRLKLIEELQTFYL